MNEDLTIEERIINSLFNQLESDDSMPSEVMNRIKELNKFGKLNDVEAILDAIKEGVKEHDKNSTT